MADQFVYLVHGLTIRSARPLPELDSLGVPNDLSPDATIEWRAVPPPAPNARKTPEGFALETHGVTAEFKNVARFLVQSGQRVLVDASPSADEAMVRIFLYGAALSILLQQRGLMPLHGSAVASSGGAVVFCGRSGQGKSSLISALAQRGLPMLGDDKVVIRFLRGQLLVTPGPPLVTLFPKAARTTSRHGECRISKHKRYGKYSYRDEAAFTLEPRPLLAVYFLEWSRVTPKRLVFKNLSTFDGLVALRRNLNVSSLIGELGLENQFLQWGIRLLQATPAFEVWRRKKQRDFNQTVEEIAEHISNISHHRIESSSMLHNTQKM